MADRRDVLEMTLQSLVNQGDGAALTAYLMRLSHSQRRDAALLLANRLLPGNPATFWPLFIAAVSESSKAYLGTFLKAAVILQLSDSNFLNTHLELITNYMVSRGTDTDREKCALAFLPILTTADEVRKFLSRLFPNTGVGLLPLLLKSETPACYYVTFRLLTEADNPILARRVCLQLMRKATGRAFNLACLLQAYYGLEPLPGSFSMKLAPYEISRLDGSYSQFCQMLDGKPITTQK